MSQNFPPTKFSTHTAALSTCAKIRTGDDLFFVSYAVVHLVASHGRLDTEVLHLSYVKPEFVPRVLSSKFTYISAIKI